MRRTDELSRAERIVLALLAEQPRHGFAVAELTATDGVIGQIWHVPQPIVYRSVARLADLGLIRLHTVEPGRQGPRRAVYGVTPAGRRSVRTWLAEPIEHVRDLRSELLVKLALLNRAGRDPTPLLERQRALLGPVEAALRARHRDQVGFDRVLTRWRIESTQGAIRFVDHVLADPTPGERAGHRGGSTRCDG